MNDRRDDLPARSLSMAKRTPARDERGQIVILTALSMTVLLAIAALAVDASFMYDKRTQLYAAADAAAKVVAAEVQRHPRNPRVTHDALQNFANQQVRAHGFTPFSGELTCGDTPPVPPAGTTL